MEPRLKGIPISLAVLALALAASPYASRCETVPSAPPPSTGGFFPLSEVHAGLKAIAWTVFTGDRPEPMDVEILGVLRGARGPGHDLILAQLHGAKPEYTGVVAGMSGSPVYVGNKLLGSLSYRIGQFTKDPIAGITPISQMLEVRDLPADDTASSSLDRASLNPPASPAQSVAGQIVPTMQAMETPLVMSGFHPEAVRFWQQKMAGTGLDIVAVGGSSGSSAVASESGTASGSAQLPGSTTGHTSAAPHIEPGAAISAQLVSGDLEIAATCTVTYVDPHQLLACGHPILQAGPVSMPMTAAEVVTTLASPLNSFKIVNTGQVVGAFNEDRDAGIRGEFGAHARMIPVHISVHGEGAPRKLNVSVIDLPALTPQSVMVSIYEALLETNENTSETSYHIDGSIGIDGYPASPLDFWAPSGDQLPAPLGAAVAVGERFARLYANGTRRGAIHSIDLDIQAIPRRVQIDLEAARLVTSDIVHAGDTVMVEATLRGWQQPARNVRIPVKLPARLSSGSLRMLVSDAATLDRTLDQPRLTGRNPEIDSVLAQAREQHPGDRIYVSLLVPEPQANMTGQTLSSLPLSVANALEPLRSAQDVNLNGESAEVAADAPAGGALSGYQILNLHIDPGGGLH